MLIVDSSFVLEEAVRQLPISKRSARTVLGVFMHRMSLLSTSNSAVAGMVVAVDGICTEDVLERRRRGAYVAHASSHVHPWHRCMHALPGTPFWQTMKDSMEARGWRLCNTRGSCLADMACEMQSLTRASITYHLHGRDGDMRALCSLRDNEADAVVLHILRGYGDLVQDLPGIPCHPASPGLMEAYTSHGHSITSSDPFRLDRTALSGMLQQYVEMSCDYLDPARHETHFPHGFPGSSEQYMDAIDRELAHLSDSPGPRTGLYVHGCAPSASDIVHEVLTRTDRIESQVVGASWTLASQLIAVLPRTCYAEPLDIHTRLDMGCVHMFPVAYQVWWDRFPLLPHLGCRVHGSFESLDVGPLTA